MEELDDEEFSGPDAGGPVVRGCAGQDLKSFEQRTTTKVLPNGLTLIVCERPRLRCSASSTFIDAGRRERPFGESGLAHMFEHLAFKGTSEIGTKDYAAEKVALAKVEAANDAYEAEYLKQWGATRRSLRSYTSVRRSAGRGGEVRHPQPVHRSGRANGAHDLNAGPAWTRRSSTGRCRRTGWSFGRGWRAGGFPTRSARVLQGAGCGVRRAPHAHRLKPIGRLYEQLVATAYVAHNYGRSGVGWPSELSQINATEAMAFHKKYYVGGDIVVAVVGDVKASEAMPMLEKYFSKCRADRSRKI